MRAHRGLGVVSAFAIVVAAGACGDRPPPPDGAQPADLAPVAAPPMVTISDGPTADFGAVVVGGSADKTLTVANGGGAAATALAGSVGAPFAWKGGAWPGTGGSCGDALAAGAQCTVVVVFAPVAAGAQGATLELAYDANGGRERSTRALAGSGVGPAVLAISDGPTAAFGTVAVGGVGTRTLTVTNGGGRQAEALDGAALAAPFAYAGGAFPGTGGSCGTTLAAGASCTVALAYAPSVAGVQGTTLTIGYHDGVAPRTATRDLTGTAAEPAALVISDGDAYDFGGVLVGTTATHAFTITNRGGVAATGIVAGAGLTGPFGWAGGPFPGSGGSCADTLASLASCTVVVAFAPTASTGAPSTAQLALMYSDGTRVRGVTRDVTGRGLAAALLTISEAPTADFGTHAVNTTVDKTLTITNGGDLAATAIAPEAPLGAPFAWKGGVFPGSGGSCGATLDPVQRCTVVVTYAPTAVGAHGATLALTYQDGSGGAARAARALAGAATGKAFLAISDGPTWDFGAIGDGRTATHTFTVRNDGALTATAIAAQPLAAPFALGATTCGATLAAGARCTVDVTFSPTVVGGAAATLTIAYHDGTAAQQATRALAGAGSEQAVLSISDAPSYDFGVVTVGAVVEHAFTVANDGKLATNGALTGGALAAPFAWKGGAFPGQGGDCGPSLAAGARCTVVVTFAPSSGGARAATLSIGYDDGSAARTATRALTGAGAQPASLTISDGPSYAFGTHAIGSTTQATLTLRNGGGSTALSLVLGGLAAPFALGTTTCGATLAPAASCTVTVSFTPAAAGDFSDALEVRYDDGTTGRLVTRALDGSGATPPQVAFSSTVAYDFGPHAIGSTAEATLTVRNLGQLATTLTPTGPAAPFAWKGGAWPGSGGSCGATLLALSSCTVVITFSPTAIGAASGSVAVGYDDGLGGRATATRALAGTGVPRASLTLSSGARYDFGTRAVGATATASIDVTNGGAVDATAIAITAPAAPFAIASTTCGATLAPSARCTVVVSFAPTALGDAAAQARLAYYDGAAPAALTLDVAGRGAAPAVITLSDDPRYDYGTVGVGKSRERAFLLTNGGGVPASGIAPVAFAGPFAWKGGTFPGAGGSCGATLAAGASCAVVVVFAPIAAGTVDDSVAVMYQDGRVTTAAARAVRGTGTVRAALVVTDFPLAYYEQYALPSDPASHDYGTRGVGTTADYTFTVSNTGNVAASAIAGGPLAAPFAWKGGAFPGAGGTCGAELAAGASCTVVASFSPTGAAATSTTLEVRYQDGVAPAVATRALAGTGTDAALLVLWDYDVLAGFGDAYDYGTRGVGTSADHTFFLRNDGKAAASAIAATVAAPFGWGGGAPPGTGGTCGATLAPGATCRLVVRFAPTQAGDARATVRVAYDDSTAAREVTRDVRGAGTTAALVVVAERLEGPVGPAYDFGAHGIGIGTPAIFYVQNVGGAAVSELSLSTSGAPFSLTVPSTPSGPTASAPLCDKALDAGAVCAVTVLYTPTTVGTHAGALTAVYDQAGAHATAARTLVGTGVDRALLDVIDYPGRTESQRDPHDFGTVGVGHTRAFTFILVNRGSRSATSLAATPDLPAPFSYPSGFPGLPVDATAPPPCGSGLAAGSSCLFRVQLAPSSDGPWAATARITYADGAGGTGEAQRALVGAGTSRAFVAITDSPSGGPIGDERGPFDFGPSGVPVDHTFALYNDGAQSATLTDGGALAAPFAWKGGAFPGTGGTCGTGALAPGAGCTVVVTWTPSGGSLQTGTLAVSYTDSAGAQSATRSLAGTPISRALVELLGCADCLSPDPAGVDFGTAGQPVGRTVWLRNRGAQPATLTSITFSGATEFGWQGGALPGTGGDCSLSTALTPGAACRLALQFTPSGIDGPRSGALAVAYHDNEPSSAMGFSTTLSGAVDTRPRLVIRELTGGAAPDAPFDFGTAGVPVEQAFSVENVGGMDAAIDVAAPQPSPTFPYKGGSFPGAGGTCTQRVARGARCTIVIAFLPTGNGLLQANVQLTYGGGLQVATRAVKGTATTGPYVLIGDWGAGSPSSGTYDYGTAGAPIDHTFTVINRGATSTTVSPTLAPSGEFAWKGGTWPGVGGSCGVGGNTLDRGASCTVVVTFSPTGSGARTSAFSVAWSGSVTTKSLSGTATDRALLAVTPWRNPGGWSSYDFGTWGVAVDRTFFVYNAGQRAALVSDGGGLGGGFGWKGGVFPGAGGTCGAVVPTATTPCTVVVTFTPSGTPGPRAGTMTLAYDDGLGAQSARLDLTAVATDKPRLAIVDCAECGESSAPVDFGASGVPVERTLTVRSTGALPAQLIAASVSGSSFGWKDGSYPGTGGSCPTLGGALAPGATCTIVLKSAPTVGSGLVTGSVTLAIAVTDSATRALTAQLVDTALVNVVDWQGASGPPDGSAYDFGTTALPTAHTFWAVNQGSQPASIGPGAGALSSTQFRWKGGTFPGTGGSCGTTVTTLAPGQSCAVVVEFAPDSAGAKGAGLTLAYTSIAIPHTASRALAGTGTDRGYVVVRDWSPTDEGGGTNPPPWDFGTWGVATEHTFSLVNRGARAVTALSPSVSGARFGWKAASSGPCALPLQPGQSCAVVVTFTPASVGTATGTLTVGAADDLGALPAATRALGGTETDRAFLIVGEWSEPNFCGDACGPIAFGRGDTRTLTVFNTGKVAVTDLAATAFPMGPDFVYAGTGAAYPGLGGTCGATLAPSATTPCTVVVTYSPTTAGAKQDRLSLAFTEPTSGTPATTSRALYGMP